LRRWIREVTRRHHRQQYRRVDSRTIDRIAWMIASICAISMTHTAIYFIYPKSEFITVDWFIKDVPGINVLWWIKGIGDILKWVIVWYTFSILAKQISRKLYYIGVLMCVKSFLFIGTFIYDYSQSQFAQWMSGTGAIVVIILSSIQIKEKRQAVVKSIK
jgi:hypothetical protein